METNKLPTAQEFLQQELPHRFITISVKDEIHQAMIEFAKLHVREALKQASEKAISHIEWTDKHDYSRGVEGSFVDEDSILNAYNLDNIK